MFSFKLKNFASLFFLLLFISLSFSQTTSFPGLYRYQLENGLSLFVMENDSAPLAYIEIAVRAGAISQSPENAGLFHLYEHMLFKGNEKYANQKEFNDGMNALGAIENNGSTGVDRINYYFTIPSSQIRQGLEFWSYAVRTPKFDPQELENEKAVVLSEIGANFTNPANIRGAALNKALFPDSPYRLDPAGLPQVVKNASPQIMKEIQEKYYIPSNTALFVGGDVNHQEVFEYVKEIYSDWKNPEELPPVENPPTKSPLSQDKKLVYVDKGATSAMINVSYCLRGPDGQVNLEDTYPADVWTNLVNNPDGAYARSFVDEKKLDIPESDYVGASYLTRRSSGVIYFYATMMNQPATSSETNYTFGSLYQNLSDHLNPPQKADAFLSHLKNKTIPLMADSELFYKNNPISKVKGQLEDSRIYELESARAILASLSFFYAACGPDYFFNYDSKIAGVTESQVTSFVNDYLVGKKGVYIVLVSPDIWENYKSQFLSRGYEELTSENAFWHIDSAKRADAK